MPRFIVKLTQQALRDAWQAHLSGRRPLQFPVGAQVSTEGDSIGLLISSRSTTSFAAALGWRGLIGFHPDPAAVQQFPDTLAAADRIVVVTLGAERAAGMVAATAFHFGEPLPLDAVTIVGPGYPRLELTRETTMPNTLAAGDHADEIWSRTRGATGDLALRRLQSLRVAVIGCGRSGQLVAQSLHRLGASTVLVDDDQVEWHTLGESPLLAPADVGHHKVEAVANRLRSNSMTSYAEIETFPYSIIDRRVAMSLRDADLIVTAVDNAAARLLANLLATLYLTPLLDIGTGVFGATMRDSSGRPPARRMGADVRLVMPGRCLLCTGGITDAPAARNALLSGCDTRRLATDFRGERSGSLASLNGIAVNFGVQMLLDWLGGRILDDARWLHLRFDPHGQPTLESVAPPSPQRCRLCRHLGRGDQGLTELRAMIAAL